MKRNLKEIDKLEKYLKENYITYERADEGDTFPVSARDCYKAILQREGYEYEPFDRHQIVVFDKDGKRAWDVICQRGSYGVEKGLLEGMGEIFNDIEGYLTAEEIIKRIEIQIERTKQ